VEKRKAVSTRTRFEVFKRDKFICQYCGEHPPKIILHIDHVKPVCEGGTNSMDNLVTSCQSCNLGKSGISLTDIPQNLADKATLALEKRKQLEGYNNILMRIREAEEADIWDIANILGDAHNHRGTAHRDTIRAIRIFMKRLDYHIIWDAMQNAVDKIPHSEHQAFKYFCGTCWNIIKQEGEVL
jgi:hypothetical protein